MIEGNQITWEVTDMTEQEFREKIGRIKSMIATEAARNKSEEQFQELMVLGLDILGEFLIDVKRIANRQHGGQRTPVSIGDEIPH